VNRLDGGYERVGLHEHLIAASDAERPQRQPERVGAGGHAAHVFDAEVGSHLGLEGLHLVSSQEVHLVEHALARGQHFGPEHAVLSGQIEQRDA
jgi:hypothetical protein